ncbi:hypothetical protein Z043_125864 [Scleropages formosus]|uniref:B30.2/SPRY domain-containing protein n=1 Tax=Scleropages formosus TaxID=113540 RepID=A0A0P7T6G2_SCLFO|nr:hypothetical protein Z043_125864 [Scleropages formosus]
MEFSQKLLKGLLSQTRSCNIKEVVKHIRKKIHENLSPEKTIYLFHCLNELNDNSLVIEVQSYLNSGRLSEKNIGPTGWSALAFVLMMSAEELDGLDLRNCTLRDEGLHRMLPVIQVSRTALLNNCSLTVGCCEVLASILSSDLNLRVLDLSDNNLQDSGVKLLSAGLGNPQCKLDTLSLCNCRVTEGGLASLVSALCSNSSHLRELDLNYNCPGDSGVKLLSDLLQNPTCKLKTLGVDHGGECRIRPGLLKYSCRLTLDPNTANRHLYLSENNRVVTWSEKELQPYPHHADRFDCCSQILCEEHLSGRFYWQVQWSGNKARIGVTYKGINRKGDGDECWLGYNNKSWSLCCFGGRYSVKHNKKQTSIPVPPFHTVGVYLDSLAGTLSFYRVASGEVTLLYRFTSTFTEPLYPGFLVWDTMSLCELGHGHTLA